MGEGIVDLRDLVECIAKVLVEEPNKVEVRMVDVADCVTLELHVAAVDMGRVIGKHGRTVHAMRTLVRAAAACQGKRATLDVV